MTMMLSRRAMLGATSAAALSFPAIAQNAPIKIGTLATLEGNFASSGQDAYRALTMLAEESPTIAGRRVEWVRESSNARADVALARARKLIEQDGVDFILGPLSGAEGIALRDYSRTLTGKTIINGSSGASDTTLRNASPNFFRFSTDGVQWMAGLGKHVHDTMGLKDVAIVAEDYAFPYSQAFGFNLDFCRLGGKASFFWAPLGTSDFSSIIARIPRTAQALLCLQGGQDGLAFLTQYGQAGGALPIIAGSVMADQTLMSARGPHRRLMVGMTSAGPIADIIDDPTWTDFVARYRRRWSNQGGLASPSLFAVAYATAFLAAKAALETVNGDLANDQAAFQRALAGLTLKAPTGAEIRLDHNRQAISDNFLTRVEERDGRPVTIAFGRVPSVTQTLGIPEAQFLALGAPSRDNTGCVAGG
jgi:branched-chain amino acid transport system substrate-binding protein